MPVFEQGYRAYVGPKTDRPRAFAIAWENVRPRMRWWVWLLLFVVVIYPFTTHFFGIIAAAFGNAAAQQLPEGPHVTVAWAVNGPAAVFAAFRGGTTGSFWSYLDDAHLASVVLPAVAAAGLLAADRRTGALQIYFARPVARLDYLLGKTLACATFVGLTTLLPALLLWIATVAFGSAAEMTWKIWVAPLGIVGAGAVYALWATALVLSLSAVMRRPAYVALVAVFVYLVFEALGKLLARTFIDDAWSMMQPNRSIGIVTTAFFDVDLPKWANVPTALGIAVGIPLALLAFTWSRVRAVEVAT
jgi:ABC-type transport system involved in multi-copper enzyme maturation permease subunit